jgi:hypothetical protein
MPLAARETDVTLVEPEAANDKVEVVSHAEYGRRYRSVAPRSSRPARAATLKLAPPRRTR